MFIHATSELCIAPTHSEEDDKRGKSCTKVVQSIKCRGANNFAAHSFVKLNNYFLIRDFIFSRINLVQLNIECLKKCQCEIKLIHQMVNCL